MLPPDPHPSRLALRHRLFDRFSLALPPILLALLFAAAAPLGAQNRAAVHKVPPVYPPIARQLGITGAVVVTTTVDSSGKVIKAESNSGNKVLVTAAIDAVKQWKFAPGEGTETFPISVVFEKN
jgi:TonB family protein